MGHTITTCCICAQAHSGSTPRCGLLGGHPQTAALGELAFLGEALRQSV